MVDGVYICVCRPLSGVTIVFAFSNARHRLSVSYLQIHFNAHSASCVWRSYSIYLRFDDTQRRSHNNNDKPLPYPRGVHNSGQYQKHGGSQQAETGSNHLGVIGRNAPSSHVSEIPRVYSRKVHINWSRVADGTHSLTDAWLVLVGHLKAIEKETAMTQI